MQTTSQLLHDGWRVRQCGAAAHANSDPEAWLPAVVPGHVHLDLLRAGVIPNPFQRMYERSVQWVDAADWTYRCELEVDERALEGARHVLRFEGLDTVASVVLNGEVVLEVDNMLVPHEVDVTGVLVAGANTLEVTFESAQRVGDERLARFVETGDTGGARARTRGLGLLSRSFVRKAQYMYGWDWGPVLRGCGIWAPVVLQRIPQARVDGWSWRSTFADDGRCLVTVDVEVEGEGASVALRLAGHGAAVEVSAMIDAGRASATMTVDDPALWWPAGSGGQPLYDLRVEVRAADGAVLDELDARIGLRRIELVRAPDDAGESFAFHVNGVPIFAKGANWIPDDSFPARTTPERVRTLLSLARECGMNMLRIWGGGLYESEDFYDTCDELGLLVWQDFAYACALYPDDDESAAMAGAEARAAIRRLRNHTSLALWCGNNENQWLGHLGAFGRFDRLLGQRLYDDVLPAAVSDEDPTRPYWPSSPWGWQSNPSDDADGDSHYWNVWHGEGDWQHYAKCRARFVSEFGFAAPPALRTLEESLDADDLGVDTPAMRWHDKTGKGYDTYLGFIELHYPKAATVEDLVYFGQLNQAAAMRFGIEHFRRLMPHTMGTLAWQLNDCWPVHSWAWIDSALRPKAAWYAAKRFYAPLLLSVRRDGDRLHAHLVNDGAERVDGPLVVRVVAADGATVWSTTLDAAVDGRGSAPVLDVPLPDDVLAAASSSIVHATFASVDATVLLVEPKDLRLPAPDVRLRVSDGSVVVESDTVAASVMLWLDGVDAVWSDNFFDLLPRTPRQLTLTPAAPLTDADLSSRLRWRAL